MMFIKKSVLEIVVLIAIIRSNPEQEDTMVVSMSVFQNHHRHRHHHPTLTKPSPSTSFSSTHPCPLSIKNIPTFNWPYRIFQHFWPFGKSNPSKPWSNNNVTPTRTWHPRSFWSMGMGSSIRDTPGWPALWEYAPAFRPLGLEKRYSVKRVTPTNVSVGPSINRYEIIVEENPGIVIHPNVW